QARRREDLLVDALQHGLRRLALGEPLAEHAEEVGLLDVLFAVEDRHAEYRSTSAIRRAVSPGRPVRGVGGAGIRLAAGISSERGSGKSGKAGSTAVDAAGGWRWSPAGRGSTTSRRGYPSHTVPRFYL